MVPHLKSLIYKEVTVAQDNSTDEVEIRKAYYSSGAILWETPYVNGKTHGIEKVYYSSGALMRVIPHVNGYKHGVEKEYYASGALCYETPYVEGKKHGVGKRYGKGNTNIACLKLYKINREVSTLRCDGYRAVSTKSYI
jgi:antitoxin component YwqK of YwqJK toxin-antitoxin module